MSALVSGGSLSNPGFTFKGALTDGLFLEVAGEVYPQDGIGHTISSGRKVTVGGTTLAFEPNAGMAYQAPLNDDDHIPGSPAAGDLYFNTTSKSFKLYDGSGWNSTPLVDLAKGARFGVAVFGENGLIYDPMVGDSGTLNTERAVKLVNGSASNPAYSFDSGISTGMYYASGDQSLCFSFNGQRVLAFLIDSILTENAELHCTGTFQLNGDSRLLLSQGDYNSPSYQLDAGIGFYHDGNYGVCGCVLGSRAFRFSSLGTIFDKDFYVIDETFSVTDLTSPPCMVNTPAAGSAAVHAQGDSDTGVYFYSGDSDLGIICGGSKALEIGADGTVKMDELTIGDSSDKSLQFTGSILAISSHGQGSPVVEVYFGTDTEMGVSEWVYNNGYSDEHLVGFSRSVATEISMGFRDSMLFSNYVDASGVTWCANSVTIADVRCSGPLTIGIVFFPSIASGTISSYLSIDTDDNDRLVYETSSIRCKSNVRNIDIDVKSIFNLTPVSFTYTKSSRRSFGFIAEDAEAFAPWAIACDKEGRIDSFKYQTMTAPVIFAVQDFIRRGDELSRRFVFTPGAEPFDPSRAVVSLLELKENRESSDNKIARLHARNKNLRERIGAIKSLLVSQGR